MTEKKIKKLPNKKPRPVKGHKPAAEILRAVVDKVYDEAWEAKKHGKLVGWSSSKFPVEIAKAFDLNIVFPENHAASVAAKKDGLRLCQAAEDMGYDNDICSYARINLAYANGESTDARKMPQPDFLLCCNNICNIMTKWYENIARTHNIPLIMVDIPFANTMEVPEERIDYLVGEFKFAIKKLEELTGKKFDEKKFEDACARANRTAKAWLKSCSYLGYKPSPLNGFDVFSHMADIVTARCEEDAAIGFELLAQEFEQSVKENTSTWEYPEEHRILFEGIACWANLRALYEPLKDKGINVTAIVYATAFGFRYNNMREMAAAYCKDPGCICIESEAEWRETTAKENGIDGILINFIRGCKPWSGTLPELERRWKEDLKIPVVHFDGDQADVRNFSEEQYKTRVQGLVEIMDERKELKKERGEEIYTNFENTIEPDWSKPTIGEDE